MFNTILVAVDGSGFAKRAVETAANIAQRYDAALLLLTVDNDRLLRGELKMLAETEDLTHEEVLDRILESAQWDATKAGAKKIEMLSAYGDAVPNILATAEERDADLIVLGTRGFTDLEGLVMGSVTHKVLHLTRRPCLIVHV